MSRKDDRHSPTKMKVLVVDDEPLARRTLRSLLQQDAEVVVAAECADGPSVVLLVTPQLSSLRSELRRHIIS
jgi:CheY-like chemotaxis protein